MSPQLTASLCFLLKDLKCKIIIKVTVLGIDASSNSYIINMISLARNVHRFLDQKLSFTVVTVHVCHALL